MRSRKLTLPKIPFLLTSILFLALIFCLTTQALADITVSGTAYDSEGGSGLDSKTIALRVDGGNADSVSTSSGVYQFTNVTVSDGSTITVWIDGDPTYKGTTVTIANDATSDITGLDIYGSTIIVRSDKTGTAITIADLVDYDSDQDTDIYFDAETSPSNTLTVQSDHELHIWTGKAFSPGGTVTTSAGGSKGDIHIDDNATFTAGGAISCGGSWTADTGTTFTHNSNTVTFDAGDADNTITAGDSDFYNLYFDDSSLSGYTISTPDSTNDVGQYTSIGLDSNGYPVVAYYDATGYNLKVMHCNDANCSGGNESIESPDTTGDVGEYASLALDSNGYPVVAYYDATGYNLKVMHCNDANCNGGDESIESPDTTGDVGQHTSITLDSNGFPVIAYYDVTNTNLKVMHCNDADCSGGNESIETVDSTAGQTGEWASIALDSSGNPVVSYRRYYYEYVAAPSYWWFYRTWIYVLHCNDANCSGGDESIEQIAYATTDEMTNGFLLTQTSLVLDSSDNPVLVYGNDELTEGWIPRCYINVVHCDDANCSAGGDTTRIVDTIETYSTITPYPSIALDSSGYPVISYYDAENADLKTAHCNDANCDGGDESIEAVDTSGNVGRYSSIALKAQDKVMVSYYDTINGNLKLYTWQGTSAAWILQDDVTTANDFTISAGTVTAPAQEIITVSGNWSNSDTFTHNSGTVTFNGTGAQQVTTGGSNWYAIEITNADGSVSFTDAFTCATFTDTTAGSTLNFASGQTATITASEGLTLTGASGAGNLITLRRYGGSGTDQWNINPSGGSWSVSYVDVKDSNNQDATVIDPSNSTDSGNNTNWFQEAYVDKASSNPVYPYVSWGNAANNIQDGINAASAEDAETVIVRAGTYDENITMTDGVDVASETTVEPLIVGDGTDYVVTFDGAFTTGCTLDGFDISGGGTYPGIYVHATAGNEINNSTIITNCLIHDNNNGPGIRLAGSDANTAPTIDDNEIYSNGEEGIDILDTGSASEDAVILNNLIHDNTLAGIYIEGTSYVTIGDNNIIYSNGGAGIATGGTGYELLSGSSVTIRGNTVGGSGQSNGGAGMYLKGSGSSIQLTIGGSLAADSNTIFYNTEAGISLEGVDQVSIENNEISYNSEDGILLIDVSTVDPHIKNNNIHHHVNGDEAGINIGGGSNVTIGDNNDINNNYAGIAFDTGDTNPSSQPLAIEGNLIHDNSYAGISVKDAITGKVTISEENDIYLNDRGGISIQNSCELDIIENKIRDNVRGGIHTGTHLENGGGFSGSTGSAVLTIKKNKVYGNGESSYGGGIDVRHASGTIYNNLVYENYRGGIRFGDYITEIIHNTVADNGQSGLGGGIIYDDLAGAVNDPPGGTPPAALDIRNNICAYNQKAGMKACFTNTPGSEERDYNLLYSNNGTGTTDCGWGTGSYVRSCVEKNYGGCGLTVSLPWTMLDPNDILAAPQFENRAADDYRIQSGSPAVDAGDTSYGNDVSIPPGVGTLTIDMGAYGGPYGIDW